MTSIMQETAICVMAMVPCSMKRHAAAIVPELIKIHAITMVPGSMKIYAIVMVLDQIHVHSIAIAIVTLHPMIMGAKIILLLSIGMSLHAQPITLHSAQTIGTTMATISSIFVMSAMMHQAMLAMMHHATTATCFMRVFLSFIPIVSLKDCALSNFVTKQHS